MTRRQVAIGILQNSLTSSFDSELMLTLCARSVKNADVPAGRFKHERELLTQGMVLIAGVDEAGRGPLAGPVVAAAAMLPVEWMQNGLPHPLRGLNDSKQLTAEQREKYFAALTGDPALRFGVGIVDWSVIDTINILQATHRAMNEALAQLQPPPEHALVDGLRVRSLRFAQTPIVDGDCKSYSIAAASVIAKVTRDRLMLQYHQQYPVYGFAEHKGYGTPQHLAALAKHGPCPIHRRSFAPVSQPELPLFGPPHEPLGTPQVPLENRL
jgi:ribonuclease HII